MNQPTRTTTCCFDSLVHLTESFAEQQHPGIETMRDYLGKVEEGLRPALLKNLLHVDLERRRLAGQEPTATEYLECLPEYKPTVRREFLEFASMARTTSASVALSMTEAANAKEAQRPTVRRLGEYHLLGELGRGGMGWVFEALHTQRKHRVALKILPDVNPESLHRFKREFRTLSEINHPNLVGLHALECDGNQWFFTMDLVDGNDFNSFVRPAGQFDEAKLRSTLPQLVSGVMALHANYVIHRDLKPSNVMVSRDGRVILLDFGLVFDTQSTDAGQEESGFVGTPAYMAPEQASGEQVTAACDWYAVGGMLFNALTGRLPFSGDPRSMLRAKMNTEAPRIQSSAGVPVDLAELATMLLARDPNSRPDALTIAKRVALNVADGSFETATAGEFLVGRERQLNQLDQAFTTFKQSGQPVAAFVDGRSGEGKTSLCDAFLRDLVNKHPDLIRVSGRCYDRETVPFKALDSSVDTIVAFLNRLESSEASQLMPLDSEMLARVFPAFERVSAIQRRETPVSDDADETEIRTRAFAAFRKLLIEIGKRAPVILFIDDLQWGDADSAEVLLQLLRPPNAPRVFMLATYRTDEADDSRFLHSWDQFRERQAIEIEPISVTVGPLSLPETTELVIHELHCDTPVLRARAKEFHQHTGGNAFLLIELLGCYDPQTDSFRSIPVHQVIEEKLAKLPASAGALLEAVAIAGQSVLTAEVTAVAGLDAAPVATLTRMRNERLLRFVGNEKDGRLDTYHDRIRETTLDQMADETKGGLHRKFASHLEAATGGRNRAFFAGFQSGDIDESLIEETLGSVAERVFDLSFHCEQGKLPALACAYSFLAAKQATKQYAIEIAETQFRCAARHMDDQPRRIRYLIALGLGDCLRLLGNHLESEDILKQALENADEPKDEYAVKYLLGELVRADGRYAESAQRHSETLRNFGVRVPRSRPAIFFGVLKQAAIHLVDEFVRAPKVRKGQHDALEARRLCVRFNHGLMYAVWFRSSPLMVWSVLKTLNHARRLGPSKELTLTLGNYILLCYVAGFKKRAERVSQQALQSIDEGDLASQLQIYFPRVVGLFAAAEYSACKEASEKVRSIVERTGDVWRMLIGRLHGVLADYRMGNLRTALETSVESFEESVRLGDPNAAHDYLCVIAMITEGRFDFATANASLTPIPDNHQATNQLLQSEARALLARNKTAEALEKGQAALDLMMKHVVVNHITTPTFALVLESARRHAHAIKESQPEFARRLVAKGLRQARWMKVLSSKNPTFHSMMLRQYALLADVAGQRRKALKLCAEALTLARSQGSNYEAALADACLARWRYESETGDRDQVAETQAKVDAIESTLLLTFEKYALLKAPGTSNTR